MAARMRRFFFLHVSLKLCDQNTAKAFFCLLLFAFLKNFSTDVPTRQYILKDKVSQFPLLARLDSSCFWSFWILFFNEKHLTISNYVTPSQLIALVTTLPILGFGAVALRFYTRRYVCRKDSIFRYYARIFRVRWRLGTRASTTWGINVPKLRKCAGRRTLGLAS